jgi:hypothetical protein
MLLEYYESRQRWFVASNAVLTILPTGFVLARFVTKRMNRLGCSVDDWLLVLGLVYWFSSLVLSSKH